MIAAPGLSRLHRSSLLVLSLSAVVACSGRERLAQETIQSFVEAVQQRSGDRLYCLLAGAAASAELGGDAAARRAGFDAWLAARFEDYEQGRDRGWVILDEQGVVLTQLFALGRGTFYSIEVLRVVGPETLEAETEVRFGYDQIDVSRFTRGTTLYFTGAPIGTVHAMVIPSDAREIRAEVLETVRVVWTLTRAETDAACPGGWSVASARPLEDSVVTRVLTWAF